MDDYQFFYDDITPIDYTGEQKLISDLEKILKNTANILIDWQIREDSIRKLGQICLGNSGKSQIFVKFFNTEMIKNLSFQLADLRSSVMKEACRIVSFIGKELKNLIEPGAAHLLSKNVLFKIAGSANRVIADSSSKCIINLVTYVNSVKIINIICDQKVAKSNYVRSICCQCILYMLSCYKTNLVVKAKSTFQETIKSLISDPNGDVRSIIRRCFITYKKRFPQDAIIIYDSLEKNIQKQINEDEKAYGNEIIINENNNENNFELFPMKKKLKSLNKTVGKPRSHEIRYKLNEIKGTNLNNNNYQVGVNENYNNYLEDETDNNLAKKKNIFNANNDIKKLGVENDIYNTNSKPTLNKIQIFKSAKGKKPVGIYGFQNSNTKNNHKDVLKKLNEKFANINNENNNVSGVNDIKDKTIENINKKRLPPIKQFNHQVNKSQNVSKSSRSVLQKAKITINSNNENNVKNSKDIHNIKIINNDGESIEKNVVSYLNKLSGDINAEEKLKILQFFYNNFKEILNEYKKFSTSTLRNFINIHIKYLKMNDDDVNLIEQIIKNLIRIIFYMTQALNGNDIKIIVKITMKKINLNEKTISNFSYKLLDIIRKKGKIGDLYVGVLNSCEEKNFQMNEICYEYLTFLTNHYKNDNYFENIFQLIYGANINSKKIGKLIEALYKNNQDEFIKLYKQESGNNQNKIVAIMENNNLDFIQEFKELLDTKNNGTNHFDKSGRNKINKIIIDSNNSNNNYNEIKEDISQELKFYLETGNTKKFISFIDDNINYVSSFIIILEKYPDSNYFKNYLNFIYALVVHPNKCGKELSKNMKLLLKQIFNILLSNTSDSLYANTIKEILYMLPIKTNSTIFFKEISSYLNNNTDERILQILLGSIKNYVIYNKSKDLKSEISLVINEILNLMENPTSDIRKIAIYCCVEIYNILKDDFNVYIDKIPKNTQNIINQIIKKKYG